ncbi:MAG: hypothetical protein OXI01_11110 [Albidovulum sp.]|nr:hypothetical protein [Albidovulum sp.]
MTRPDCAEPSFSGRMAAKLVAAVAAASAMHIAEARGSLSAETGGQGDAACDAAFKKEGACLLQVSPARRMAAGERSKPVSRVDLAQASLPNGATAADQREEAFKEALKKAFPMTPDMVRKYREIFEENERAIGEIPEPEPLVDSELVVLAPGDPPPSLRVAPGIASVIGFFDAYGNPWPIRQHVVGNGDDYRIFDFGEGTNSLAVSPAVRVGWTNLVVALENEPLPVVARIVVDRKSAHYRHDIRVLRMARFEQPKIEKPSPRRKDPLQSALAGFGMPSGAKSVPVEGAPASAWLLGDSLYVRSPHPLASPPWTETASRP